MPAQYERDDARRRVTVSVRGPFSISDMIAVIERQRAEDAWGHGILYDLRQMTEPPTRADLRALMGEAGAPHPAQGARGPVALLTGDPVLYGLACAYAALGRSKMRIQVFRDLEEANAWLAEETGPQAR